MKRLIVNADDLGYTEAINRGILEANARGIVTSTSLMVDRPAAEHGAAAARGVPRLSVGLHAVIDQHGELTVTRESCDAELSRQLARFEELMGGRPTHIDSHHHTHREPLVNDLFVAFAGREGLPMREQSVRHEARFFGAEAIGVGSLLEILGTLEDGDTELGCHPGYVNGLVSTYGVERERELRTLTDPRVRARVDELGIALIGWDELA